VLQLVTLSRPALTTEQFGEDPTAGCAGHGPTLAEPTIQVEGVPGGNGAWAAPATRSTWPSSWAVLGIHLPPAGVMVALRVPWQAKAAVVLARLWLLSPIDLLPEFLPVIGPLDDVVVVALTCAMRPGGSPARCCWRPGPARCT